VDASVVVAVIAAAPLTITAVAGWAATRRAARADAAQKEAAHRADMADDLISQYRDLLADERSENTRLRRLLAGRKDPDR
jgi:hypothetical protein